MTGEFRCICFHSRHAIVDCMWYELFDYCVAALLWQTTRIRTLCFSTLLHYVCLFSNENEGYGRKVTEMKHKIYSE